MVKTTPKQGRLTPLLLTAKPSTERIVMLNRKSPLTLAIDLTIKGQGAEEKVAVVFHNRTQTQIADKNKELAESERGKDDAAWVNKELFLFVVKEFNGVVPTHEGVAELEDNWPGSVVGVFYAFHDARRVEVRKN
jgi:hypothetical protein